MIFLNPTILLGLLATAIPVLLHFLNLRKIKKVEFSTLHFLKEIQKAKIRKIKIKQIILLLIRILIIIFLVSSFARPTLENKTIGLLDSGTKATSILLLDNSNSMGIIEKDGSLLNQSKDIAKRIYEKYKATNNFYLLLSSAKDGRLLKIESKESINRVELSAVTRPLIEAIYVATEKLKDSKDYNKELYIISDFQQSTFFKDITDSLLLLNKFGKVYLFNMRDRDVSNLGIIESRIENKIIELNKNISITSQVRASSNYKNENNILSLFLSNKRVAQKQIKINKSGIENIHFKTNIAKPGLTEIVSEVDDEIEFDNKYYFYLYIPKTRKILIVNGEKHQLKYFEAALKTAFSEKIELKRISPQELNSVIIDDYDVIVINDVKNIQSEKIGSYVKAGGRLILFPTDNINEVNRFNKKINLPVATIINENAKSYIELGKIDFSHPIFNGVFNKKRSEIASPRILKHLRYTPHNAERRIISAEDGASLLSEYHLGKGKILLWAIAPSIDWSDFPLKNSFAPIMIRTVLYLGSPIKNEKSVYPGEKLIVNIAKRESNQIRLIKPDGTVEAINIEGEVKNNLEFYNTESVGIYKFYSGDKLLDVKCVNINPAEQKFAKLNLAKIKKQISKSGNSVILVSPYEDYLNIINAEKYGSELWKLFLIIALLLSLVEMLLARSSRKDIVSLEK